MLDSIPITNIPPEEIINSLLQDTVLVSPDIVGIEEEILDAPLAADTSSIYSDTFNMVEEVIEPVSIEHVFSPPAPVQTVIEAVDVRAVDTSLVTITDTIYHPIEIITNGLDGKMILSLPNNESWVFGALTALFFILIFASRLSPGLILEEVRSVFQVKERSSIFSSVTLTNYRFRYVYIFFSLSVFSLFVYTALYDPITNNFSFLVFLKFLLIFILFFVVKILIIKILGYVFLDPKTISIAQKSYFGFIGLLGMLLFPLLVIYIYASEHIGHVVQYVSLGICGVIAILFVLKLFQIFFSKSLDFFYILLYLCTLEILPVLVLLQVFQMIQ